MRTVCQGSVQKLASFEVRGDREKDHPHFGHLLQALGFSTTLRLEHSSEGPIELTEGCLPIVTVSHSKWIEIKIIQGKKCIEQSPEKYPWSQCGVTSCIGK